MQKLKLLLPLALLIGVFFMACQDEDFPENSQLVDVTFAGRIIDENGTGVEGALVNAGDASATTDKNGVFRLESVRLAAMHAMVKVSKAGFFEISRPYIVEDEALQTITIQLLTKTYITTFSANQGGGVNVPGGPKLSFPANAIVDEDGNAFSGNVNVYARYLDPSDPKLGLFLPGDMTAENASNEEVFLATYGMLGVEIQSNNGQKLKIATGQELELRMPILASQLASAPSTIPLWHYDLEEGHWKEEGAAQKIGNEYVGKVSHFSFWNCDAPFPLTQLHGRINLENTNQPLANAVVRLTMLSTGGQSFAYTDANGDYGGCIPKDELLKLEVVLPENCGSQVLYTQNIGPFPGVSTLSPIIIAASAQVPVLKIEGSLLDCNNQSIDNGYVKFDFGNNQQYFLFAKPNGSFEYVAVLCSNSTQTGSVIGYDLTNLLESKPVNFSIQSNAFNVGPITVCTALTEYIQYTLDGQLTTKLSSFAGIGIMSTQIGSQDSSATWINLKFASVGQTGEYPITSFGANNIIFEPQLPNSLKTNVSTFGANQGDLIIGTFGGNFQSIGGLNHTLSGSYRVIRE
jgi:hypothetical protein